MKTIKELVSDNIKKLRDARGLTQAEFAEQAGISLSGLQDIEYGKNTPTVETLIKISSGLKISAAKLLGEEPFEEKSKEVILSEENDELRKVMISMSEKFEKVLSKYEQSLTEITTSGQQSKLVHLFEKASVEDRSVVLDILEKTEERIYGLGIDRNTPIKTFCNTKENLEGLKLTAEKLQKSHLAKESTKKIKR